MSNCHRLYNPLRPPGENPSKPTMISPLRASSLSNRREFLKGMTALGMASPVLLQSAWGAANSEKPRGQIENRFYSLFFDPKTGRLDAWRNGEKFLSGAVARANVNDGPRSTADPSFQHHVEIARINDPLLGAGMQLEVQCVDSLRQLDLSLRHTIYDERDSIFIEASCRNISAQPVVLKSLEPLCVSPAQGGALHWPGVTKVLTNGPMYYDCGQVADFLSPEMKELRSWWNTGFFRGYHREGLVCGYVQNNIALGQMLLRPGTSGSISLIAESVYAPRFELPPGQAITSNRFMIHVAPDPYTALENYAQVLGDLNQARFGSILNGWCDWPYAFESITENEMLASAEFAARVLKPYGFEYIQVDEGFQRWHGDWEGNAKFPHGMKWLADRIHALGLKPGIWLAPYVISEPSEVFQKHPEWMLRLPDGTLKEIPAGYAQARRYALDITHPGAAEWLYNLFDTVTNKWGYELIKIDFVDWSLLSAERYHDPSVSRAAAYRKGIEIMRKAIGPQCHLLDCGPGPVSVGMLDSMRIELDQPPVNWNQYFLQSNSSAPAAAKRYYFHKRAWINDDDHVCLAPLTLPQAQAAASLIALTGGNTMSGDRLPDLDASRLEILKKIYPSYGEAARPVDLFDTDRHSIFALKIQKPFGVWTVAAFFNASEKETVERSVPLERLWLDSAKTYLAFDFWKERMHGLVTGELKIKVAPASVTLLALHEKTGVPQVVSTDRHVLQGAVELENVAWDSAGKIIEGVSLGPEQTAHHVWIHLPEAFPWFQGGPFLFHDFPGYTVKMMSDHLLRIRVRFEKTARVAWKVSLAEFLKR